MCVDCGQLVRSPYRQAVSLLEIIFKYQTVACSKQKKLFNKSFHYCVLFLSADKEELQCSAQSHMTVFTIGSILRRSSILISSFWLVLFWRVRFSTITKDGSVGACDWCGWIALTMCNFNNNHYWQYYQHLKFRKSKCSWWTSAIQLPHKLRLERYSFLNSNFRDQLKSTRFCRIQVTLTGWFQWVLEPRNQLGLSFKKQGRKISSV